MKILIIHTFDSKLHVLEKCYNCFVPTKFERNQLLLKIKKGASYEHS